MNIITPAFKTLTLVALVFFGGQANAHEHLSISFEPRTVYLVSSKTEGAWATCRMCQGRIRYDRTWKRDHSDGSWIETTKCHPTHCRKCEGKIRELNKYCAEEARLDLKLAKKDLKSRIRAKRQALYN